MMHRSRALLPFVAGMLCLILFFGMSAANSTIDPQPPHLFYGNVTIVGIAAPANSTITAMVDGGSGILVTTAQGVYGGPGALSQKLLVQGEIQGQAPIEFYVNGMPALCREHGTTAWGASYPYSRGGVTHLDLDVAEIPLVAEFSGNPTGGYVPLAVQFSDRSSGFHDEWAWNFGDGGSSEAQNPVHVYHTPGTYTVTLTVRDSGGGISAQKIREGYITVSPLPPAPVAAFSANRTSGDVPLAVAFNDLSSGSPYEWSWNFGDSGASVLQNPVQVYSFPGTYTVSLTIRGISGIDTETKVGYITVRTAPPYANFTANRTGGNSPLAVAFTDLSTGVPDSWAWNFGDGGTATARNPVHTYTRGGLYTVSLTVSNGAGTDTFTRNDYINVTSSPAPTASFTGTPIAGYEPLLVRFNDTSTGNITLWSWAFGDGTTASEKNSEHTYRRGNYSVSLTVSNETGSDTLTKSNYITVYPGGSPGGGGGGGGGGGSVGGGSVGGTFYLGTQNATKTATPSPSPTTPQSGTLPLGPGNATTQQVTIVSSDGRGILTIGVGVTPTDASGSPLHRVTFVPVPSGSLPPGAPCTSVPHAYEILPAASTFTPGIQLMFSLDTDTFHAIDGQNATVIAYNASTRAWQEYPAKTDQRMSTIAIEVTGAGIYAVCGKQAPPTPETTGPTVSPTTSAGPGFPSGYLIPVIILIVVIVGIIVYVIGTRTARGEPPEK